MAQRGAGILLHFPLSTFRDPQRTLALAQPHGRLAPVHADEAARDHAVGPDFARTRLVVVRFRRQTLSRRDQLVVGQPVRPRTSRDQRRARRPARQARACDAGRLHPSAGGRAFRAPVGHCFYASDGASAVEIALKMSFHYWRNAGRASKTNFVGVAHGYHGETAGALSVTDIPLFRDAYGPLLRRQASVPSPDARLAAEGVSPREHALAAAGALDAFLAVHHETTAAMIVEPMVQGAAGMAMHDREYLVRAREICTRYGVHLIADEIMTGFGRTGTMFACEHAGIAPDMLCLSKGITGGYLPLSVVLTSDGIYDAFYDDDIARGFLHSHSYTGNALACRAALAVLDLFRDNEVLVANRACAAMLDELARPLAAHPRVAHFRRLGMIWAFDMAIERDDFARWFTAEALRREMLLRPIGRTVYWMPPYCLAQDEMEILASRTLEIVACA